VLRRWALFPRGGDGTWDFYPDGRTPRAAVEARFLANLDAARRFRLRAEAAELSLEGETLRGPVQSRPDWEAKLGRLEDDVRTAWAAWADALFADPVAEVTSITANADNTGGRAHKMVTIG